MQKRVAWNKGKKTGQIPWNKGKTYSLEVGPTVNQHGAKKPNSEVFVENSDYARPPLRRRILKENIIPYVCQICGIGPKWQGKSMPLILDHINGINNDHRIKNLRFVCSNCDSQLPTYKSKNKNGR